MVIATLDNEETIAPPWRISFKRMNMTLREVCRQIVEMLLKFCSRHGFRGSPSSFRAM
jgi:hypothetical protein